MIAIARELSLQMASRGIDAASIRGSSHRRVKRSGAAEKHDATVTLTASTFITESDHGGSLLALLYRGCHLQAMKRDGWRSNKTLAILSRINH